MRRLTWRSPQTGKVYVYSEDANVIDKLADYEDLEEQGLLLRLPCKVGDTFWELNDVLSEPAIYPRVAHSLGHIVYCLERLGRICFLTEKEAEEALKKMQEVESDEMRKVWKRI